MKYWVVLGLLAGTLEITAFASEAKPKPETFDFSFSGGTPAALVAALERATGTKPNVLVPPRLAQTRLPKMELRDVSVESVFMALSLLTSDEGRLRWTSLKNNVWVLQSAPQALRTQVFYVGDLLQKFKIDDLNTAILTAWKLDGNDVQPELKYHQETQLLLARADAHQLSLVNELLTELRRALPPALPRLPSRYTAPAPTAPNPNN